MNSRPKISAFVISYNREKIIGTTLRALAFVDELILVDKGSRDATVEIAAALTDRIVHVPWTPTVEGTRRFAASLCSNDWILFLDDDEVLTPEAVRFIDQEVRHARADIYRFRRLEFILGEHNGDAYYWPETHVRLYKRGSIELPRTVQEQVRLFSSTELEVPAQGGAAIMHLSHADVAHWIEKANQYTSKPDRVHMPDANNNIVGFAHASIDKWVNHGGVSALDNAPVVVGVLRSTFDIIDQLKSWEEKRRLEKTDQYAQICSDLDARFEYELDDLKRDRRSVQKTIVSHYSGEESSVSDGQSMELERVNLNVKDILRAKCEAATEQQNNLIAEVARREEELAALHTANISLTEENESLRAERELMIDRTRLLCYQNEKLRQRASSGLTAPSTTLFARIGRVFRPFWRGKPRIAVVQPDPDTSHLWFPIAERPVVSIIILTCGQFARTVACLQSIADSSPTRPFEILVVDDRSGNPAMERLKEMKGIRYEENPEHLGFLKSCNRAAALVSGQYLYFLKNDTEVTDHWLDALLDTFTQFPSCGLVGSKLVFPDGRLQEAGRIIWSDASSSNYGRNDDPNKPEYNYVREVDYVSGASMLVARSVWEKLGGFDEAFAPASREESDFAFKVRQAGLKVFYQPESVVVHHGGASRGTDVSSGIKSFQRVNQVRFARKWSSLLEFEHYPRAQHVLRARERGKKHRVLLIIDHYCPEPDRDAGSRTIIEVMKSSQMDGWIIKLWPDNLHFNPRYTKDLQQLGIEVLYTPWVGCFNDWLTTFGSEIDAFFLSCPTVAPKYIESIKLLAPDAPILFYGHDLHSARMKLQSQVTEDAELFEEASKMEVVERHIWKQVDVVLYPSEDEISRVKETEPSVSAEMLLPYCFDEFLVEKNPPASQSVIFVAGFNHAPNVDAALWLADEIFPLVKKAVPEAELWIVGSNPTAEVQKLVNTHIKVTGYVTSEKLSSLYKMARAAIVPLRFGAGIKLKVVESLYEGIPLVTTQIGAQGLVGLADVAFILNDPETIAQSLVQLLTDDQRWTEQSRRQLNYVKNRFSRKASRSALHAAFDVAFAKAKMRGEAS